MKEEVLTTDAPGIRLPPPLVFLAGLLLAWLMDWLLPVRLLPEAYALPVGLGLMVIGAVVVGTAVKTFIKRGTNVDIRRPATRVVTTGPYRFSRNPIYVGMGIFALGAGALVNTFWILATLIPTFLTIELAVIVKEEKYLEQKFGDAYLEYKKRVRRWGII